MKTQSLLIVLLSSFVLSGCGTLQKLLPAEHNGKVEKYETLADVGEQEFVPVPVYDVGDYPPAQILRGPDGKEYGAFDKDGMIRLMELRAQHRHNTQQLKEANTMLELQVKERNEIYNIGLGLQEKANLQAEKVELREKELSALKRKTFIQRWTERGVFLVLLYFAI